ncbi:ArsR family transcriptional regulator [Pseudodesulfovibrio methanolicus]|uniref:ArsR family transcriptional regulator n=1 Tax=Pseudodesulfovibrio methanolicus TaxID=3126690 RepID=A0ABZ2J329_9BACT
MSYGNVVAEHLRLTILRLLAEQPDYTLNDSLIRDMVPDFGFRPSRDVIRSQLAWLDEQGLVGVTQNGGCRVAHLTERGEEVAKGYATVPGVKRPSPGGE